MQTTTEATTHEEQVAPWEAWDAIAGPYDAHVAPGEARLATAALTLAGLRRGDRMLDVAAGTGGLSLPALRLGAHVTATDWAPRMIERFRARVKEEALTEVESHVMDCHALDFPADRFDLTGSQFGVMLVADQARALREMVRVTRPGGRVLLIAYGNPAGFEALHAFVAALKTANPEFPGIPSDPPPLEFQVADPEELRRRLGAAGLRDVVVDTSHREEIEVTSGQALWDWVLGGNPIASMLVSDLSDAQHARIRDELEQCVRVRRNERGVAVFGAPLNIGFGTK